MRPFDPDGYRVAVVGATGAVGREMTRLLGARTLPVSAWIPMASARSAGMMLESAWGEVPVRVLSNDSFDEVDIALFSAGGDRSLAFAPVARDAGAVVIDNSSAWRMHPDVPLVVPEVNPEALRGHGGIIANPNCSTIQLVLCLQALHARAGLRRVVVSTYQSASGAGQQGIDELLAQSHAALAGHTPRAQVFPRSLAFDCIPQIGGFAASGYTAEEEKMVYETRKILGIAELAISATCVRVPVLRGHQESVTVDLERTLSAAEAIDAMKAFPGLRARDGVDAYPTAADASGSNDTFFGRVREDISLPTTLHLWIASDNLLKGAAWNAVQIAELLHAQEGIRVS